MNIAFKEISAGEYLRVLRMDGADAMLWVAENGVQSIDEVTYPECMELCGVEALAEIFSEWTGYQAKKVVHSLTSTPVTR